jgi:hypothetical protein
MRSFWDYGHGFAFSPRVKPIGRARTAAPFQEWRILCRVTGRDAAHKYHGMNTGRRIWTNARNLYADVRTIRGTFGRLEYSGGMTAAEFEALPIVSINQE